MFKLAVITGGIRGIGAAISVALKENGYEVVANYEQNHQLVEEFSKKHSIKVRPWNVADFEECKKNIVAIEKDAGKHVSVLINNAGVIRDSMLHKMDILHWRQLIDINLSSCFNMCKAVIDNMRNNNFGRIISISSINAQAGQTNYSAAKAGIIGFTKVFKPKSSKINKSTFVYRLKMTS